MYYNKMFSILTRGRGVLRGVSDSYRHTDSVSVLHKALVPNKNINPFIDYATEQLIQCVMSSTMVKSMRDFDPVSKYNYPLSFPIIFEHSLSSLADNINVSYRPSDKYNTVLGGSCGMIIDCDSNRITFTKGDNTGDVIQYTYDNNLSGPVEINKNVVIHINNLDSGVHNITLNYKLPYNRTLLDVYNELPASAYSRYDYAKYSQLPDYMACIIMDVCRSQEKF